MLGRGLGCEVGVHVCIGACCMAEGGEMVYTINKCLGDLLSSAKGGARVGSHTCIFSADHNTHKQQVGIVSFWFSFFPSSSPFLRVGYTAVGYTVGNAA